jgi:hypothetical protein
MITFDVKTLWKYGKSINHGHNLSVQQFSIKSLVRLRVFAPGVTVFQPKLSVILI